MGFIASILVFLKARSLRFARSPLLLDGIFQCWKVRRGGGWRGWGAGGATNRRRRRWRTEQAKLARTKYDLAALLLIPANGETPILFEIHRSYFSREGLVANPRAQVA